MVAVTLLGVAVGYGVWHTNVGRNLELGTVDSRFQLRGTQRPWPGVVVVGIDADSQISLGRFPWPRRIDANMIRRLLRDGVRTIAFDLVFATRTDNDDDLALYDAANLARSRLVLAADSTNGLGATYVLGGVTNQRAAGIGVGSANFPLESDGTLRRVPFRIPDTPAGTQSFAVASALSAGIPRSRLRSLFDGDLQWIDFPGPPDTVPTYSFADVLAKGFDGARLRGKIVVIGTTANALHDYSTIGGWPSQPMQGPEIEADAISTLMTGAPLRSLGLSLEWLELALAALILPALAVGRLRWPRVIAAAVIAVAAVLVSAQLAFDSGVITLVVAPLVALLVSGTGAVLVPLAIERRELRTLRDRFARFDPAVVDAVLSDPGIALRVRAMAIGPESVIAGYRLISLIGRGGMGVVYEGVQLTLDRPVALKLVDPARVDDQELRARFVRESHVAAQLEHPHVIPVYEAREDNGLLFIAMRLVRGPSFADVLAAQAPLPPARAAMLVAQIASALGSAHAKGLVHRDVKPANILLHEGEHAYLTDFGITFEMSGDGLTAVGERIGTVDYMSPEQIRGEAVGPESDIYSLGCVLCEALTGRVPFADGNEAIRLAAHLQLAPPVASERWPSVPPELDLVILTALAKEPGRRFVSAEAFAAAVTRAAGIEPPLPPPPKAPPAPRISVDESTIASG